MVLTEFFVKTAMTAIGGLGVVYGSFAVVKFAVRSLNKRVEALELAKESQAVKTAKLEEAMDTIKKVPADVSKLNEKMDKLLLMLAERGR